MSQDHFLPMTPDEMKRLGWEEADIILVTGDAYVDHPSFGTAVIGRWLEHHGYRVGIVSQPRSDSDFLKLGHPRLWWGVTSGNLDSMVCHYTSLKKIRHDDAYTPGGRAGMRPDRAIISYCQQLRRLSKGVPLVIGGIEAGLRRLVHYDYWSETIKHPIILDAKADILVYGMGESAVLEITRAIEQGLDYRSIRGIAYGVTRESDLPQSSARPEPGSSADRSGQPGLSDWIRVDLPSYESIKSDPQMLMISTITCLERFRPDYRMVQACENRWVVVNPPQLPLSESGMDAVYDLPYCYLPHPSYQESIPAFEMIRFSVTISRGCPGGCSFCALSLHQGRLVQSRTPAGILREIDRLRRQPGFKGYIKDLGGPTANLFRVKYRDPDRCRHCRRLSCLFPDLCSNFQLDLNPLIELYRRVRQVPGIKKAFICSGIRYDLVSTAYLKELVQHHISGQLKIAPEHLAPSVLELMHKPSRHVLESFLNEYARLNREAGLKQFIVPYYISGFPGCRDEDMLELKHFFSSLGFQPQQIQDFLPIPMTLATAMYYTETTPDGKKHLFVAKGEKAKRHQKDLLFRKSKPNRTEPARSRNRHPR